MENIVSYKELTAYCAINSARIAQDARTIAMYYGEDWNTMDEQGRQQARTEAMLYCVEEYLQTNGFLSDHFLQPLCTKGQPKNSPIFQKLGYT